MREVIECVWIQPVFHRIGPLLIGDLDVSDRFAEHSAKSIDDLIHRGNFDDQFIPGVRFHEPGWRSRCGA